MTEPGSPPDSRPIVADHSPQPPAQPVRRPRLRRSWGERFVLAVGVIATTTALMAASVLAWGLDKYQAITRIPVETAAKSDSSEPTNWLLVGSDSREGVTADDPDAAVMLGDEAPAGKRTDTMIVARVDPAAQTIDLLSLPRDLYVPIAGTTREGRINSAFIGEGGEQRLIDTVEGYFGIEIHHYAEVNFVGFRDVVDALGGVPIWFDQPMRDDGSGLAVESAGCHVLGGSEALAFARGRNVEFFADGRWQLDGTGDLGRTSRQQYFIRRVAATASEEIDLTSIGTVNKLLDVGGKNLSIDQAVSVGDLLELASTFGSVPDEQVRGHSLPVYNFRSADGAAVLGLQQIEADPILAIFRGEAPQATSAGAPASFTMRVLNGSRVAGQASEVAALLGADGFEVSSIDNAPTTDRTRIVHGPGLEPAVEQLARYLVVAPAVELDPVATDLALVTGSDFDGIRDTPLEESPVVVAVSVPEAAAVTTATTVPPVGVVPGPSPEGTACS